MKYLWIVPLLLLIGCSQTEQGNTTRTYKDIAPMDIMNSGQYSYTTINIESDLTGSSEQDQSMGDASSKFDVLLSAAWEAAQSMATKEGVSFMEDIFNAVKKNFVEDSQNTETETGGGGTNTDPLPDPSDGDGDNGNDTGDVADLDDLNLDDYEVAAEADCDQEMSYRTPTEAVGTIQKKCVFDKPGSEYGSKFILSWSSGNKLLVPSSSSMAWDTSDYRKYQPAEPDHQGGYVPNSPAEAYAGRGDNSTKVQILIKKESTMPDVAGWEWCESYQWKGSDPDPVHHRSWWS